MAATKYEDLSRALVIWNQAVLDYDQESLTVVGAFLRGLVGYLGAGENDIMFLSTPDDEDGPGVRRTMSGGRYTTERDGYGFTPALVIRAPGARSLKFKIDLEFYKEKINDRIFTLRLFDKDHQFSDVDTAAFEPLYETVFQTISNQLLKFVTGAVSFGDPTN